MLFQGINKLVTHIKNIYYTNSNFTNNLLAKFNLYFERNNKISYLLTNFGNTYKNSK